MIDLRRHVPAIIATSAFWVLLFGAYLLFGVRRPLAEPIQILPPPTAETPSTQGITTPAPLRVYVSGAVVSPGVYRLSPDSVVQDAVTQAGGPLDAADLVAINLAHPLSDGEQIYVPIQGEEDPPAPIASGQDGLALSSATSDRPAQPATPIDLNTASAADLDTLPGVGPKRPRPSLPAGLTVQLKICCASRGSATRPWKSCGLM